MEKIKKVTQKKLCQIAKELGAKRIGNCCYQYECAVTNERKLIKELNLNVYDEYELYRSLINKQQLYYSCGVYGNSGQLHYITYLNEYGIECSCYVYYTDYNYNKD